VKLNKLAASIGIAAVAIGVGVGTVAPASAASNIKPFGQSETLIGPNGAPQITYTVHGLNPSSAAVPHNGELYEANVTVEGGGIPNMLFFNARAEDGANYRVIGGSVPGTIFFDRPGAQQRRLQRWCSGSSDVDPRTARRWHAAVAPRADQVAGPPPSAETSDR